eukprot:GHVT01067416.1.p4 GENE.GHVT01067416.1~~GHVT01067416.1.p4  ORF type:complete len:131 (-),score=14.70 GHVT01067416.1:2042-2434(-)
MASGMGVHEDCVTEFTALKIRKTAKWMIFNIANDKVSLEKKGLGDSQEFKSHLPNDDCRFGVYDLGRSTHQYPQKNAPLKTNALAFIERLRMTALCPDRATRPGRHLPLRGGEVCGAVVRHSAPQQLIGH